MSCIFWGSRWSFWFESIYSYNVMKEERWNLNNRDVLVWTVVNERKKYWGKHKIVSLSRHSLIWCRRFMLYVYQKHRTLILIDSFVKWYKKGIWNCGILVWYFWENDFIWGVIRFADGRDMIVSSLMGGIEWQSNCRHPIMIRKSSTRVKSRLMLILSYKLLCCPIKSIPELICRFIH